ncbi:sensor histidine kinase [Crossiella sp. CA-258035]|uniref:sensor histidine kinase n=1 Tax=Crossiella sp. CA-258035 TaxID=2981138 RepID=UPI0024BC5F90|nr:sensor histidine kinase [Crossiella sp. CA-258035]WHT17702.1 sensor histidine kinase [Crossiella sp. CA-258035]
MGVIPELHPGRAAPSRWVHLAWVYGTLAVSGFLVWVTGEWPAGGPELTAVLVLLALAVLWLPWLPGLVAQRRDGGRLWVTAAEMTGARRWLAIGYFAGMVAINGGLMSISAQFAAFASVGFPFAFLLFPPRGAMIGVGVTAVVNLAAQTRWLTEYIQPYSALLGLLLPLAFGGWVVGRESERRRAMVTELTAANAALREAMAENSGLHAQLLTQAREAGVRLERQRMAREIHDTIAQGLTGIITQLNAADRVGEPERKAHLDRVRALAADSLAEARRSVRALRPEPLSESPLPEALAELTAKWGAANGITPRLAVTGTPDRLATGVEVVLFRVAQEALTNIAKHAKASRVGVTLSYEDDLVLLDIVDDGVGITPSSGCESTVDGYGIGVMRQRVRGVGGVLEIESGPGQGTAVAAAVPVIPFETREGGS